MSTITCHEHGMIYFTSCNKKCLPSLFWVCYRAVASRLDVVGRCAAVFLELRRRLRCTRRVFPARHAEWGFHESCDALLFKSFKQFLPAYTPPGMKAPSGGTR